VGLTMERNTNYGEKIEKDIDILIEAGLQTGGFPSHINIYAKKKESDEDVIIRVPLKAEFMDEDENKDFFIEVVLPEVGEKVKSEYNVDAVMFISESYLRMASKDFDHEKEDYRSLPVDKEALIIKIETKDSQSSVFYEIKKDGMKVVKDPDDDKTDLVDNITLEFLEDLSGESKEQKGRFSNLLKYFV